MDEFLLVEFIRSIGLDRDVMRKFSQVRTTRIDI